MSSQPEDLLQRSREYACKGFVLLALEELELAREHAFERGVVIPPEMLQEIETTAYKNGAETELVRSIYLENRGKPESSDAALRRAGE